MLSFNKLIERFEEEKNHIIIDMGFYYKQIKHWLKFFPKEQFLILIFEELMNNPTEGLRKIANFLDLNYKRFNFNLLEKKVNHSTEYRFHNIFVFGYLLYKWFNSVGLYRLTNFLSTYIKPLYQKFSENKSSNMENHDLDRSKKQLYRLYENDIRKLENLLERDLDLWKIY